MTNEEQRIAIAEACGLTVHNGIVCHVIEDRNGDPELEPLGDLPDYPNDLNAMQEAVLKNAEILDHGYQSKLREIVMRDSTEAMRFGTNTVSDIFFYHATAAQRAEAFLKTKGLWKP